MRRKLTEFIGNITLEAYPGQRIAVIGDGQIVEFGSHRELLAQKGKYYELYTGQRLLD